LESLGLVQDTGMRTATRGGVGTFYALDEAFTRGMAVRLDPETVVAEIVDIRGLVSAHVSRPINRPVNPVDVVSSLESCAEELAISATGKVPVAVVSAADPVDRHTGSIVELPASPFLLGHVPVADILAPFATGTVLVDNDVNWAARAEHRATAEQLSGDFVYLSLGEGIGAAVVSDGTVVQGHSGLAGEVLHVLTAGPQGAAMTFTELVDRLGIRYPASPSIDVAGLRNTLDIDPEVVGILADGLSGLLVAAVAFLDPEAIVIGGSWGTHEKLLKALAASFARHPRSVMLRAARVRSEPSLQGVRQQVVHELREHLVSRIRQDSPLR